MDHPDIDDIQIATGRDRASREIDAYDTDAEAAWSSSNLH